jgi:hypothetical protein
MESVVSITEAEGRAQTTGRTLHSNEINLRFQNSNNCFLWPDKSSFLLLTDICGYTLCIQSSNT